MGRLFLSVLLALVAAGISSSLARAMANPDPTLVAAIKASTSDPELRRVLLATAIVESGGRLNAVGDNGSSFGPYQMHRGGRLDSAGYTPAQAMDPLLSTKAAIAEFLQLKVADPGLWAARAQRPASPGEYAAKVRSALPEAERILGQPTLPNDNPLAWISDITAGRPNSADIETSTVADKLNELNPIAGIVDVLKVIVDPDSWKRAGMGIGGAVLLVVAAIMIVNQSGAVERVISATSVGKLTGGS